MRAALAAALVLSGPPARAQGAPAAPVTGQLRALTVFARFADQARGAGDAVPSFASQLFVSDRAGSLAHYYREMSRGQFRVDGDVLPAWVNAPGDQTYYTSGGRGYGEFVADVLVLLDQRLDTAQFDNDGPDGRPNSGDDDGYVDFVFVITPTAPEGFILGPATGIAGLGLAQDFVTDDAAATGGFIRVRADEHADGAGGVLQRGHTLEVAVGNMAHELAHFLGLVDLYDASYLRNDYIPPSEDSAGIGYWGLMGHGPRGWNEQGGPNPMCAWSLKRLGWLGIGNRQLQLVETRIDSAVLEDVNAGGTVYQLPIRGQTEYLLVEVRRRGASYYERNLPAEGVLIWHIDESKTSNDAEQSKLVDLVCADGLYRNGGFGYGPAAGPAPSDGGDNLDFWAHDESYTAQRHGNLGDATDVFDGERYTDFWVLSNPAAPVGVSVTGIRRQGERFVAALDPADRRRAGNIDRAETWSGLIEVVGDVTIRPGTRVDLSPGTRVVFAADGLAAGLDPGRCELIVEGELAASGGAGEAPYLTSAAPGPAPGDWYGIRWLRPGAVALADVVIEYPEVGITVTGAADLRRVTIRQARQAGIVLSDAAGPSRLDEVEVSGSAGYGAVLEGGWLVRVSGCRFAHNRGGGLLRTGGALACTDSEFEQNGAQADTAANLTFGSDASGSAERVSLAGGVGVRCLGSKDVSIFACRFAGSRAGVVSVSSQPRVSSNTFEGVDLVLDVDGFAVPRRVDLNTVQAASRLVRNRSGLPLSVTNNWWGTDDASWIAARMEGPVTWEPFLNFDPRQQVSFRLAPGFPNPSGGAVRLRYDVGVNELVVTGVTRTVVEIRSVTGALVRRLVDRTAAPGVFETAWDGRDQDGRQAASGVYYCELRVGPIVERTPLTVVR